MAIHEIIREIYILIACVIYGNCIIILEFCWSSSLKCCLSYLSTQYYNIRDISVAPYYYTDGNATHPTDPPLLYVIVLQYNKWRFDASTHNNLISHGTHPSELVHGMGGGGGGW